MAGDPQADVASLQLLLTAAESERDGVRSKLHNAIRKGKALEAEKKAKAAEAQELSEKLAAATAASSHSQSEVSRLQAQLRVADARLAAGEQQAQRITELQARLQDAAAREAALADQLKAASASADGAGHAAANGNADAEGLKMKLHNAVRKVNTLQPGPVSTCGGHGMPSSAVSGAPGSGLGRPVYVGTAQPQIRLLNMACM